MPGFFILSFLRANIETTSILPAMYYLVALIITGLVARFLSMPFQSKNQQTRDFAFFIIWVILFGLSLIPS